MEEGEIKNQVEAVLFAVGKKMPIEEIAKIMGLPTHEILQENLLELQREYDEKNSPLMIVEEEKGIWKLTTREKYVNLVRNIVPETELSKTMMETLAVVAWKQPITQSEVIHIRTNKAYDHVKGLEEMGFLVKERYGRTYLLKLTQKFYNYFDLSGEAAARELFKDFKDTEAQRKLSELAKEHPDEVVGEIPGTNLEETNVLDTEKENNEVTETSEDLERQETPEDEKQEDVYNETDREDLREEDEIKTSEDGFMQGYEDPEKVEEALEEEGVIVNEKEGVKMKNNDEKESEEEGDFLPIKDDTEENERNDEEE
jgi:segregation and condensation protein B